MKTTFIKPNPYVFPFKEFGNLDNRKVQTPNISKSISFEELASLVKKINKKEDLVEIIFKTINKSNALEEQLLQCFMHPLLCFGEKSMYEESREMWLSEFRRIISNKKIQFSIMGFPFKVTNPLKTSRISPDLGEVMAMQRLENIALLLEKVSKRNISIVVISEGGLSKQVGYDSLVAEQYAKYAKKVGKKLGFTHLSFLPLSKMEKMFSDFDLAFKEKAKELTKQFKRGDSGIVEKVNGAQPIILRIVKHPNLPLHELMDMYNFRILTENLSPRIKQARESLGENATKATLEYFAYLALRDESQFLTKELGKNTITLTVSPKPNRLGIIPIQHHVHILPHHGVPIFDEKTQTFDIVYLIDLLRMKRTISKIYLINDLDTEPFYYSLS